MLLSAIVKPKVYGLLLIFEFIICSPALFSQTGQVFDLLRGPIYDSAPSAIFGFSLAISDNGKRVAIGMPNDVNQNGSRSGAVQVYEITDNDWVPLGDKLIGDNPRESYGARVALSGDGNRLAFSAPFVGDQTGAIKIFEWNGNSWQQLGETRIGPTQNSSLGSSLSFSYDGQILAAGANNLLVDGRSDGGVFVYEWQDSSWNQRGDFISADFRTANLGESVSISQNGNTVAIGIPFAFVTRGAIQVYDWQGGEWIQRGQTIGGQARSDNFGRSVSLSSNGLRLLGGASVSSPDREDVGYVRIYEWQDTSWISVGQQLNATPEDEFLRFGFAISGDGRRVSFPAFAKNDNEGEVRIFEIVEGFWQQIGSPLKGDENRRSFGTFTDFSFSGDTIAISIPSTTVPDDTTIAGSVEVYTINPGFARISGAFLTPDGQPVQGVQTGLDTTFSGTQTTDSTGVFLVSVLDGEDDQSVTIRPTKMDTSAEGLTTLDLLAVAQHILGRKPLTTPYQLLAADVNRDGYITVTDLLAIYNWILGNPPEDAQIRSWRFVVADHSFDNPHNPLQETYPNQLVVPLAEVKSGLRFMAIKPGDVVH